VRAAPDWKDANPANPVGKISHVPHSLGSRVITVALGAPPKRFISVDERLLFVPYKPDRGN